MNQPRDYSNDPIVNHIDSHSCVIAGPGTGKTDRLTHRAAKLIADGVEPKSILCVTFTRAAAAELKGRLSEHADIGRARLPVAMNLHALALMLLARERSQSGIQMAFRILDDWEERKFLVPALMRATGRTRKQIQKLLRDYEADWNELNVEETEWVETFDQQFAQALKQFSVSFGFTLRGELVYLLKQMLDQDPIGVRQRGFRHILVDEFQDLNPCDMSVIDHFVAAGGEVMVCGDDDQSIYRFRQAAPIGLLSFGDKHPPCEQYELMQCHRCPQNIIDAANRLMDHSANPDRLPKTLVSTSAEQGVVHALQFASAEQEAKGIGAIVDWLIHKEGVSTGKILILCPRKKYGNKLIKPELERMGIEFQNLLVDKTPLDTDSGRRAYYILRAAVDKTDAIAAMSWLILSPKVGGKSIQMIEGLATSSEGGYPTIFREFHENPQIFGLHRNRIGTALDLLLQAASQLKGVSLSDVIQILAKHVADNEREDFVEYLGRVADTIVEDEPSLEDLISALQTADLYSDPGDENGPVRLMTLHKAKGLNARAVILSGMEREFLLERCETPAEEEECRRLFYVSITRSEKYLFITHSRKRYGYYGQGGKSLTDRHAVGFLSDAGLLSRYGPNVLCELDIEA